MSKAEKIKKTILIALGFGLSTYLILQGAALLQQEKLHDANTTGKVHSNTVQ